MSSVRSGAMRSRISSQSSLTGRAARSGGDGEQPGQAVVERRVAALDQSVGVEDDGGAGLRATAWCCRGRVRGHAEEHVRRPLQQAWPSRRARAAAGAGDRRWTSAASRAAPGAAAGGSSTRATTRGGQRRDPGLAQRAVERAEHLVGIAVVQCRGDAPEHVAQLSRHGGGGPVVAGDVADHERRVTSGGDEGVVPVAADLHLLGRGPVADGDVEVLELRGIGQQGPLEALGEAARGPGLPPLGLPAGDPVDRLGALRGEGLEDTDVVVVEGAGVAPSRP